MAVDPSVKIDIAAEFTGKKAFDRATKSTSGLEKGVKNLAKTFGVAFGATAVLNFAKSSAKAFIEDDNAARSLSVTIKNLGLAYGNNAVVVSDFINNLEKQTGVLDDELRPAMDRLLRATGSVSKSQELLNLSLDIAAGTGKTVTQVSQSLQKAYLGQNAAIGRLGVGISKAELATGEFADIQEKLTKLFAGQSEAAAKSYAGQLAKLQVAANNAKETIGKGLVDALKLLASDTSIDELNTGLEKTSQYIADLILGVGVFIQKLKDIPVAGAAFQLPLDAYIQAIPVIGAYISILANLGKEQRTSGLTTLPISPYYLQKQAEAAAKAAAKAAAQEKANSAAKLANEKKANAAANAAKKAAADKKALANEKAKAALSKAAAVFDITKIQIAAALKATYDKDERLRLLAMQEIENDNGEAALKYINQLKLLTQEQQTNQLAGITAISQTELDSINAILLKELDRISSTKMTQEQADEARAEAYRKYNAAIISSGGLAEANFYTEKTQTDLLKVAKLAALHDVATAQATLDILNYTTQTDIIARIAAAQKLADDAKTQALKDYLTLLATAAGVIAGLPGGPAIAKGTDEVIPRILPPGVGGGGQPIPPGYGGIFDYVPPAGAAGSSNSSVTVIVEGSVLNGSDFVEIVNDALLDAFREGRSQFPAGTLPG